MAQKNIIARLKKIRMVLMDVDGVLTDGRIIIGKLGLAQIELKNFHSHDGFGIRRAQDLGLAVGFISARESDIVPWRAQDLGVTTVYHGAGDKLTALEEIKKDHQLRDAEIAYIGDDMPDLPVIEKIGFSCSPADAVDEIRKKVDYVATKNGGHGAVREILDLILRSQKLIK